MDISFNSRIRLVLRALVLIVATAVLAAEPAAAEVDPTRCVFVGGHHICVG